MHCHKNVCEFTSTFRLKVEYVAVKRFSRFVTFRYLPSYAMKNVEISGPRGGTPRVRLYGFDRISNASCRHCNISMWAVAQRWAGSGGLFNGCGEKIIMASSG